VDAFVEEYFNNATPAKINSFLDTIVNRINDQLLEERQELKSKMSDYRRKYSFISQIISFEDTSLEKLYIFLRFLIKKLPIEKNPLPTEVLESIDMESYKVVKKKEGKIELENEQGELYPLGGGSGSISDDEKSVLSKIINDVNERFGTNFSDSDRVILNNLSTKLMENKDLEGSIRTNSKEASRIKFNQVFQDELITMLNSHFDLYKKLDGSIELKEYVNQKMFDYVHKKVINEKLAV
jgi:type I restriction enzyme R subunit